MFHELRPGVTPTTDMAVLPGVLGCSFGRLRTSAPCDVPFMYASGPIPRYRGTVARWHAHLHGLATAIHETSGLGGINEYDNVPFEELIVNNLFAGGVETKKGIMTCADL